LLPSGLYTDRGATELRRLLLERCRWEWLYGFENREGVFPIDSRYKFESIVVQRGDQTNAVRTAFMRRDLDEWQHPNGHTFELAVGDIRRFAPKTLSFLELKSTRELGLVERLYDGSELLGRHVERAGGRFQLEFMMNTADKLFAKRKGLIADGLLGPDDDTRDPRVRADLWRAGLLPLYEGKSFFAHDPYFLGRGQDVSVSKFVPVATIQRELEGDAWRRPRLAFRDIASSTNQRTLVTALLPSAVHGNPAPTIDDLPHPELLVALLGSLPLDFVIRMKVSAHLNWHYVETLPIANWTGTPFADRAPGLVHRLNALGGDFPEPAEDPLVDPAERLAARLLIDALVADLYGLHPDDVAHIATRFPIYDKDAGEHRYTKLAVEVAYAMYADGPDAAQARARELAERRRAAGVGFGLDEVYVPEGGWAQANREAREILADGPPVGSR
jgi:hypothetical protein